MRDTSPQPDRRMPRGRLCRLVSSLCDGSIDIEEHGELASELSQSSSSRATFTELLEIEASLEWELASQEVVERMLLPEWSDARPALGPPAGESVTTRVVRSTAVFGQFVGWVTAAAVVFAVGVRFWTSPYFMPSPTEISVSNPHRAQVAQEVGRVQNLTTDCAWYVEGRMEDGSATVAVGETVRVLEGEAQIEYDQGAFVVLAAPAVFEVTAPNAARLISGKLRGRVSESARGFTVMTPRASVVDYGTAFGINVDDSGGADVVVYEGEVGIQDTGSTDIQLLKMGDGVRLDKYGTMSRLVAFTSNHFPSEDGALKAERKPIITRVQDNIMRAENLKYYEIVVGGMCEDARAYVDREFHQWNGYTSEGMPSYLLGADFVRMFNDDKLDSRFELSVTVGQPAMLYVLYNESLSEPCPPWLSRDFEYTGDRVGLDVGPMPGWTPDTGGPNFHTGVGPGNSVETTFKVWRKRVATPGTVKLGGNERHVAGDANMYAIAATPLD